MHTLKAIKSPLSAIAIKVREGLDKIPPGTYSISDLQRILCANGDAMWNTAFGTVKAQLQALPDWNWNGKTAPGRNKWVKDPKPMPVPHDRPQSEDPIHKGPVTTHLEHIEAMLEALCHNLGIVVPNKD